MGLILFILTLLSLGASGAWFAFGRKTTLVKDRSGRDTEEINFAIKPLRLLPGLAGAFLFFTLFLSYQVVDAGNRGILKHFGHVEGNLLPGLHFCRPIGTTVTPFSVQSRIVKPNEDAATLDTQIVHFEVTFRYHIDPDYADYVFVQDNGDPEERVINPAILEAIKSTTSQYNIQDLIGKRTMVRDGIEALVTKSLIGTHVIPEATAITDFKFSKDYENAIEAKQVAQQKAEQAVNDLQRIKVEAQQAQAEAVGSAQAKVANANGEAESVLIVAKAKAEAQRLQKQDITPELIQIRTIELMTTKWDGQLPSMIVGGDSSGMVPMFDVIAARNKAQEIQNWHQEQREKKEKEKQ